MKTIGISILYIILNYISSAAQDIDSLQNTNKPYENISVNKQYDENGKLIQYDSVYTYSSSNYSQDTTELNTIIGFFPEFFNQNFENFIPQNFNADNTTFFNSFFNIDSFEEGFFNQDKDLLQLLQKMDSIQNEFFKEQNYSDKDI